MDLTWTQLGNGGWSWRDAYPNGLKSGPLEAADLHQRHTELKVGD